MKIGFLPTNLALTSLPFRDPRSTRWERRNGNFRLNVVSPRGLPWGSYGRLFAVWLTCQAKRQKKERLDASGPYADVLKSLGLDTSYKTRRRFLDQAERFLNSRMTFKNSAGKMVPIVQSYRLWWNHRQRGMNDGALFESFITVSPEFLEQAQGAMPVLMRHIRLFQRSPFQLDIYAWLNHRFFTLRSPLSIPYIHLQRQFGARFKNRRHFKSAFQKNLSAIKRIFSSANAESGKQGVRLSPSLTAIQIVGGGNMGCPHPQKYSQSGTSQLSLFQDVPPLSINHVTYQRVNGDAGNGYLVTVASHLSSPNLSQ